MAAKTPTNPRGLGRIKTTGAPEYTKLTLRLPKTMHKELQALAEDQVRGMNGCLLVLLDFALEHYPYTQPTRSERLRTRKAS